MASESFCSLAATLDATETFHRDMPVFHHALELLACMAVAGFMLSVACGCYVNPVCRMEHLGL